MRIAIVKLSALGDIVHAMVVLQAIKEASPFLKIDWIVEEIFVGLLEHNPHIDHILPVNLKALKKDKSRFFIEIQKLQQYNKYQYDMVIDLQGLIKSAVVSKILGKTIGFDKKSIREKWASLLYKQSYFVPYQDNVIERNMALVEAGLSLNINKQFLERKQPFLYFSEADKEKMSVYVVPYTIVYILGSSWESKVYPKEKFIEIIDSLEGNHLLVWGNNNELRAAEYIADRTNAKVMPKMDLNALKALIAQVDLVIGGDSGPTHFAWALNRPSITIFGPTPSYRNTVITKINKVVDCGKEIDPLKLNKQDFCIENIESSKIIAVAQELLA
jgi:heptosyltransferase-1